MYQFILFLNPAVDVMSYDFINLINVDVDARKPRISWVQCKYELAGSWIEN